MIFIKRKEEQIMNLKMRIFKEEESNFIYYYIKRFITIYKKKNT